MALPSFNRRNVARHWLGIPATMSPTFLMTLGVACIFLMLLFQSKLGGPTTNAGGADSFGSGSTLSYMKLPTPPPGEENSCAEIHPDDASHTRYRPSAIDDKTRCLKYIPPSHYISVLMKVVIGLPRGGTCGAPGCWRRLPLNPENRYFGRDWPPDGYTMIGTVRLENLRCAITDVVLNRVPGSIVEMGVWRGGAMIVAAAVVREFQEKELDLAGNRPFYLYDAYDRISAYGGPNAKFLSTSVKDVKDAVEFFDLGNMDFRYIRGFFKDTLPTTPHPEPIAVLRVDGNFYDSYQDAMYSLYEKVSVGGIVIFDDIYTHKNVMRFWKDFKSDQGITEELVRIDKDSAWFRKERQVKLDLTKMKPPQDANK